MTRLQLDIFFGLLAVVISAIFLVIIGVGELNRMSQVEEQQLAEAIEIGAGLFDSNCSGCHGPTGQGITGIAPALNDPHFFTGRLVEVGWSGSLEDYVFSTVAGGRLVSTRPEYVGGGRPAMPAWSQDVGGPLREDQIRDIAKFVLNWEETAVGDVEVSVLPTPTLVADTPIARGEGIFVSTGCSACHAMTGISEAIVGPNLSKIGEIAATREEGVSAEDYIRKSIINTNAYIVEGYAENIMPQNFGEILSSQELDDLVAYLLEQK